jgi:hypothetical protein
MLIEATLGVMGRNFLSPSIKPRPLKEVH